MTSTQATPRTGADTFTRYATIACAVISPLAIALSLLLASTTTAEGRAYVQQFADNQASYPMWAWISALSAITLIPALLGLGRVVRPAKPTLGLVGLILAFIMALPISGNSDDVLYAALKSGLDVDTTTKLYTALSNDVPTAPLGLLWFAGLIGLVVLGVAALLGRSAPGWAAVTLIVAPILIPIPWFAGLPTTVAALPWLLMTAAFGGVTLGLLRDDR